MSDEQDKVKRPASQYYWGDWFRDLALQSCSQPARGLWHEMNCLMHQGEPYGHLTLPNGKPMEPAQLANLCKISTAQCKKLLQELEDNGVSSRAENGALFSRRMVRDEAVRNARAAGGKGGAEHGAKGAEHGSKGGRPAKEKGGSETPLPSAPKPPPSSSSSPSASPSGEENPSGSGAAKPRRTAGKNCPESFAVTPEMVKWANQQYPNVDPTQLQRETDAFRGYTFPRTITDWPGAWRNWIKKASESLAARSTPRAGFQTGREAMVSQHLPQLAARANGSATQSFVEMEAADAPRPPALPGR